MCFVSSLGFFFFVLSRDKNTRESERCVCGKKKVRARSVFPSSDDDEHFEMLRSSEGVVGTIVEDKNRKLNSELNSFFFLFISFLYRLQQKYVRYKRGRCARFCEEQ